MATPTLALDGIETTTVAEARTQFADLCNKVAYGAKTIVVTRHGKPTAAIISIDDLQALLRLRVQQSLADYQAHGGTTAEELAASLGI